jgi:hypothetical protein
MSDLFSEHSFPIRKKETRSSLGGEQVRVVYLEQARRIARLEAQRSAGYAAAPLEFALAEILPLARLALAHETSTVARARMADAIERAAERLDQSRASRSRQEGDDNRAGQSAAG